MVTTYQQLLHTGLDKTAFLFNTIKKVVTYFIY